MRNYGKVIVPFLAVILLTFILSLVLRVSNAEPIDQYQTGWSVVRDAADEDGATFAAVYDLTGVGTTNGQYSDISSDAFRLPTYGSAGFQTTKGNEWVFTICGKNYNNTDDTFSFNLVGWAKDNGMLQVICEGNGVLGTQAVVEYPEGTDALGELVDEEDVAYTHSSTTLTVTNEAFENVVAGMLARVTGSNLTNEIVQVTTATDSNNIVCSGITSTDDNTDSTVQINPAFWADTITLDETTKWSGAVPDANTVNGYSQRESKIAVYNSGDNEVAQLVVDLTGLEYIQFIFYDCDAATGEEAGDIRVYGRPN